MNKTQLGGGEEKEGRQRMLAEHPPHTRARAESWHIIHVLRDVKKFSQSHPEAKGRVWV